MPGADHPATIRRMRALRAFVRRSAWRPPPAPRTGRSGDRHYPPTSPVSGALLPGGEGPNLFRPRVPRQTCARPVHRSPDRVPRTAQSNLQSRLPGSSSFAALRPVRVESDHAATTGRGWSDRRISVSWPRFNLASRIRRERSTMERCGFASAFVPEFERRLLGKRIEIGFGAKFQHAVHLLS